MKWRSHVNYMNCQNFANKDNLVNNFHFSDVLCVKELAKSMPEFYIDSSVKIDREILPIFSSSHTAYAAKLNGMYKALFPPWILSWITKKERWQKVPTKTWSLYYKTFYICNCSCILKSWACTINLLRP
jgi:hypothetical protein